MAEFRLVTDSEPRGIKTVKETTWQQSVLHHSTMFIREIIYYLRVDFPSSLWDSKANESSLLKTAF